MTKTFPKMTSNDNQHKYRNLTAQEIETLTGRGCSSDDWNDIYISEGTELLQITNVHFSGEVKLGANVRLRNITGTLSNCRIGDNAVIENVNRIQFEPEALCGIGTQVAVLDETGSRPLRIYPGLSSQIATLMAREPKWLENNLSLSIHDFLDSKMPEAAIGEGSVIRDTGRLINVSVGKDVIIDGAKSLVNGSIINNSGNGKPFVFIGPGVDAENFIIEDAKIDSGAILRNCYVGQGVEIGKGFTAHDSAFFANSTFENGEACALLAGPYSVSMHKGTLLIGCQTSFMNAGSSTNQSNHMYKLGPVHWGVLERGVKTASGAYVMLGAKIGAFSMIMGQHKTHPDSSMFPFSYLFGDERGATVIVPGAMLRSCGLMRDEMKWPTRDRRQKRKMQLNDRITFNVLNPFTVDTMLNAIDVINELLSHPADDDLYVRYKGMKVTRAALERAKYLYTLAIFKYLSMTLPEGKFPEKTDAEPVEWTDLGGQIITRATLQKVLETESIEEAEQILEDAFENYGKMELDWVASRFSDWWREKEDKITETAAQFDNLIEEDRKEYLDNLTRETKMLTL